MRYTALSILPIKTWFYMETFLSPELLDSLGKASGFVVLAVIVILLIATIFIIIRFVGNALKQSNDGMNKALSIHSDSVDAARDNAAAIRELVTVVKTVEKAMANQDRVVAQIMGTVEAQGVINAKLGDTLNLIEISFRTHNKVVTDTLSMLAFDVNDLQDIVNKRADGLTVIIEKVLARLDALPADVAMQVKEHVAVILLQSTPTPPKAITNEVATAILATADKKPRVNGAAVIDSESDKGTA